MRLNGASEREWAEWVRYGHTRPPVRRAKDIRERAQARKYYRIVYEERSSGETHTFGWSKEPDGGSVLAFAKLVRWAVNPRVAR